MRYTQRGPQPPLSYQEPTAMAGHSMDSSEKHIRNLLDMDLVQLRKEWFRLFHSDPATISEKLLLLGAAYKLQEIECDTSGRCKALRQKAAESLGKAAERGYGYAQGMKPGTRLLREYDGVIHEILAVEGGRFVYNGQICRSLSDVVFRITGTRRSAKVFFGLKSNDRGVTHG
jgi:hypothetical protein